MSCNCSHALSRAIRSPSLPSEPWTAPTLTLSIASLSRVVSSASYDFDHHQSITNPTASPPTKPAAVPSGPTVVPATAPPPVVAAVAPPAAAAEKTVIVAIREPIK
ncbi:MAG: hypothetical protein EA381_04625 [Planctomycetaceae bacterium]|nr:MAG: hypothetical protein EA381_04625 [Planctomycetaceae bacterium]